MDALCIHQEDEKVRNHQVSFMGDIYKQAEVVLAWLGDPSDPACDNKVVTIRFCQITKSMIRRFGTSFLGLHLRRTP